MIGRLGLDVEAVIVAADKLGFHLLTGRDLYRTTEPLTEYEDPHRMALAAARSVAGPADVPVLHQTSSRYEEARPGRPARGVWTYVAVVDCPAEPGVINVRWPMAVALDPEALLDNSEPPTSWLGPDSPPPTRLGVALHAVRHLALLIATDDKIALAMPPAATTALLAATPALSGMFHGALADA